MLYVVIKYKNLEHVLCPQGTNDPVEKLTYKMWKKSKIDLIHINDKLNDTDTNPEVVRGKNDTVEVFWKGFI